MLLDPPTMRVVAFWITNGVAIAVFLGIIILIIQGKRSRFSQRVDLLLKIEEQFFVHDRMLKVRKNAAAALRKMRQHGAHAAPGHPPIGHAAPAHPQKAADHAEKPLAEVDALLDFFDSLGLMVRKRALDKTMVGHAFYHWLHYYYRITEKHIHEKQKGSPGAWKNYVALHQALAKQMQKGKTAKEVAVSEEQLAEFLDEESVLETKTPTARH